MSIKQRVQQLCRLRKVTMSNLELELGFAKGYLSKLDSTNPTADKVLKIAGYFGVSTDYLLTGTVPSPCESGAFTPGSSELLKIYTQLDASDQETLMLLAHTLASRDCYKQSS